VNVLRGVRSLVLGETWALPVAVALLAGAAILLHEVAPELWSDAGAALLLVAVPSVLVFAVRRTS
jgi:hypothetical protein